MLSGTTVRVAERADGGGVTARVPAIAAAAVAAAPGLVGGRRLRWSRFALFARPLLRPKFGVGLGRVAAASAGGTEDSDV